MPLHPATLLVSWIACAGVLPWLGPSALAVASGLALLGLLRPSVRARAWRLFLRARVLIAAVFLIYGFASPGAALVPDWPSVSPTLEGLRQGAVQACRLLLLLASIAWLLETLGRAGILAGVYTLLRPLRVFGVPTERFAVRLSLVMELAESAPRPGLSAAGLAAALDAPPSSQLKPVTLDLPPATWRDILGLVLLGLGLGWLLW